MLAKKIALLPLTVGLCMGVSHASAPLIQDGKSEESKIYQRVLTTPGCVLKKNAADKSGESVPVFSRYYVYADDGSALQVGADANGTISGFLDKGCTVQWKMQTALMFTNPANRDRSLIFKDKEGLDEIVNSQEPEAMVAPLLKDASAGRSAKGIISIEPETYVDYKSQFYLLPILDSEETMFDDGNYVRELNIASVTKKDSEKANAQDSANAIKTFKSALVFVIDSSISMQPYIDRTKKSIDAITTQIKENGLEDSVHFGLVSFRSNTKAVKELEYTSKVFVKPGEVRDAAGFALKLKDFNQAKVSSKLFDEDSFAGINDALQHIDWKDYGGRYIVLITDAGGIEGTNELSTTKLDAKELRAEAQHKGVAIYALHLLTDTPNAKKNQPKAKAQYEDLTYYAGINKSLYYPIEAADVNVFGKKIDKLGYEIAEQVKRATLGMDAVGSKADEVAMNNEADEMTQDTLKLGYAMQLAYLGQKLGTKSPDFLTGWIADRDLKAHDKATCTPVVLLTKNELSSLYDVTRSILESADKGQLDSEGMFNDLRAVAVNMGRDPSQLNQNTSTKIKDLGILGEFLEGLPYKSQIQDLDEDSWAALGPDEQNQTIQALESKLNYYKMCNEDSARWIKLNEKEDISNAVYPIPLEELP